MPSLIFKFNSIAEKTHVAWLTVKANVITLFTGEKFDYFKTNPNLDIISKLKDDNPNCGQQLYSWITDLQKEHVIINPHISEEEKLFVHKHLKSCDLISPKDFNNFLDQLKELQKNSEIWQELKTNRENLFLLNKIFAPDKLKLITYKPFEPDIPLVAESDIETAKEAYAKYFAENEEEIRRQYQQISDDLTIKDELKEIGGNMAASMLRGFVYAALNASLTEVLVSSGVSRQKAQLLSLVANLLIMCLVAESYYPVLFGAASFVLSRLLGDATVATVLTSAASAAVPSILNYSKATLSGFNAFASIIAAVPVALAGVKVSEWGTKIGLSAMQRFWNKESANADLGLQSAFHLKQQ